MKLYKQVTIQHSKRKLFDKEINMMVEIGWKILDNSYNVIKKDSNDFYSQVLYWEEEDEHNIKLKFEINNDSSVSIFRTFTDEGGNRLIKNWIKKKIGQYYKIEIRKTRLIKIENKIIKGKRDFLYQIYKDGKPHFHEYIQYEKIINKKGDLIKLTEYNEDCFRHGRYLDENIEGNYKNGYPEGSYWNYKNKKGECYQGRLIIKKELFHQHTYSISTSYTSKDYLEQFLIKNEPIELSFLCFNTRDSFVSPDYYFKGTILYKSEEVKIISGKYIIFYSNGNKIVEYIIKDKEFPNLREPFNIEKKTSWYENGKIKVVTEYNREIEKKIYYYPDGKIFCLTKYNVDKNHNCGTWERFFPEGNLNRKQIHYDDGSKKILLYDSKGILIYESKEKSYKDYLNDIRNLSDEKKLLKYSYEKKELYDYRSKGILDRYLNQIIPENYRKNKKLFLDSYVYVTKDNSSLIRDTGFLEEKIHFDFNKNFSDFLGYSQMFHDIDDLKKKVDKENNRHFSWDGYMFMIVPRS